MKLKLETLIAFAALCGTTLAEGPAQGGSRSVATAPAPAAAETVETDEIDLDKFDDSADAARKVPKVKMSPPSAVTNAVAATAPTTNAVAATAQGGSRSVATAPATAPTEASPEPVPEMAVSTGLVDIDCDDATLADILRQFRKTTGANIISADSSNLQQRVSVSLRHVPWLSALQAILNTKKFRLEPRGEIYFVSEDKQLEPIFTRTFMLNHASAKELAELFNSTLGGGRDPKTGKQSGKQIATAFEGANVVVVTASEKVLADCEQIIKSVDRAIPQIYIEARFIEVSNEAMHKLGVQWNQLESWGASVKNVGASMGYANGRTAKYNNGHTDVYYTPKNMVQTGYSETYTDMSTGKSAFNYSEDGKNVFYTPKDYVKTGESPTFTDLSDGSSALNYRAKDYLKPTELPDEMAWRNFRTFTGQLSADDFKLAMSAFEQIQDAKIFSNPKIIVSNGKEARVDMTTKFPNVRVQATRNTSNGSDSLDISTQLEAIPGEDKLMFAKEVFFSWGITLSVRPRISPNGLISVEIIPTISQLDTDVTPTGFYQVSGGDSSAYSSYPIIQIKRLTTDFTMKDGATAVIGGLSRTTEGDIDSGIPYLRKIPWIGPKLFGWKSRGKVQKEIIVFVTLGMADPSDLPTDVGLPKNAIVGREYVAGRKAEPGDRKGGFADVMSLDMRSIEEKQAEERKTGDQKTEENQAQGTGTSSGTGSGTVTITPVQTTNQ